MDAGAPPVPEGQGQVMPDPMEMVMMLLEGAVQKWQGQEAMQVSEQDALIQTLLGIVQGGAPIGPEAMPPMGGKAPGAPVPTMGMEPPVA